MKMNICERRMSKKNVGENLVKELEKDALNNLLEAIGLSRSTYYYEIGKTDAVKERNADLSLKSEYL